MSIHTPDWVKDAIFYQIFPDRFARSEKLSKPGNLEAWDAPPTVEGFKGGDLLGVVEHLDYLQDLGITAIYFNPIFQSTANHRYHTHDYRHVDPILGGDAAFREMIKAAHGRGIRVMLDGVFNHASRGFYQFNHLLENGPASPYLDWFKAKKFPVNAYDRHGKPNYECWWGLKALPKFNTETPAVREFIYEIAELWLREGIDGWRLDVPLEIKTPGFWEEFRRRVKTINPEAYILAEIWEEAREWLRGEHFDATMNYVFNRACLGFFGGAKLDTSVKPGGFQLRRLDASAFAKQIERMVTLYDREVTLVQYNLLSSHDMPRFLTLVGGDKARLKLATLFQMTFLGTPSIYYGDEIGLEGGQDPDCRRAFPWDQRRWDHDLLASFKRYVALRKAHTVLRYGDYRTLYAKGLQFAYARTAELESFIIAMNTAEEPASVELDLRKTSLEKRTFRPVWEEGGSYKPDQGKLTLTVPPLDAVVLVTLPE